MADPLRTGSFDDLEGTLAGAIDAAMQEEWEAATGEPLPGGPGEQDRHILFAAIAKGVLRYLHTHRADLQTNKVKDTASGHRHKLNFDVE